MNIFVFGFFVGCEQNYQKNDCERNDGEGHSAERDFEHFVGKLVDRLVVGDEVALVLLQNDLQKNN